MVSEYMRGDQSQTGDKIIALPQLPQLRQSEKLEHKRIVLAGGCFDVLHYGHLTFLNAAKKKGDILIILLEADRFIKEKKHRRPVHVQKERAAILAALAPVDYVVPLPDRLRSYEEYSEIVNMLRPAVIAVTEGDSNLELKNRQAAGVGATVEAVTPVIGGLSSSSILKNL